MNISQTKRVYFLSSDSRIFYLFFFIAIAFFGLTLPAKSRINIISPRQNDTIRINSTITIEWDLQNHPVNVYYSVNKGRMWNLIKDSLLTNKFDWTVPKIDTSDIMFRVSWNTETKPYLLKEVRNAHQQEVRSVAMSKDGKYFVSSSLDGWTKIWEIETLKPIDSIYINDYTTLYSATFHHSNDSILIAADNTILLWERGLNRITDLTEGKISKEIKECTSHPTQNLVAFGSFDCSAYIIDIATHQVFWQYKIESNAVYSCRFSQDGQLLAVGTDWGYLYIFDWVNGGQPGVFGRHGNGGTNTVIWDCNISSDNHYALSAGVDATVRLWDFNSMELARLWKPHLFHARVVEFSPDSSKDVLSAALDGTVHQMNIEEGYQYPGVIIHGGQVLTAGYLTTRDTIFSGGRDNAIRLWRNFDKDFDYGLIACRLMFARECDSLAFNYQGFDGSENINYVASAFKWENAINISMPGQHNNGAVWYKPLIPLARGFKTEFSFRLNNGNSKTQPNSYHGGGDGFAFVLQCSTNGSIGYDGFHLGYAGLQNSLAVEFDTYKNDSTTGYAMHDPLKNHIAVQCNGFQPNNADHRDPACLGITENIPDLVPDGRIFYCRIDFMYKPSALRIFLDTVPEIKDPVLVIEGLDLRSKINFLDNMRGYAGFTAATGDASETHELLSWSMCPVPEYGIVSVGEQTAQGIIYPETEDAVYIDIDKSDYYTFSLYDMNGRTVADPVVRYLNLGKAEIAIDRTNLISGMYYYTLKSNIFLKRGKFILIK